jgi:hypothetical protein
MCDDTHFPVPVLADSLHADPYATVGEQIGEARESTKEASPKVGEMPMIGDSRGGERILSKL